ncbi:hypothetical protein SS1G_02506 [Sclerotinia sclerotiorum 1980 UF-70]|uniref:Uncharacterized protein n=1 Tax=Sclerotinia sclerotiorum (strain ATCC 18683 / 1980 / Ss-1) TaxID=665079 RepID=A7EB20_SCLS1|nr:hypothetical protein SS1G_02506 [Sclerotinia sclerotiorum 1980 UF-70]EDN99648.1 hypothetical protein SS1G_02506 [Sclerotinia sclerotiorum 1980 UF-70]
MSEDNKVLLDVSDAPNEVPDSKFSTVEAVDTDSVVEGMAVFDSKEVLALKVSIGKDEIIMAEVAGCDSDSMPDVDMITLLDSNPGALEERLDSVGKELTSFVDIPMLEVSEGTTVEDPASELVSIPKVTVETALDSVGKRFKLVDNSFRGEEVVTAKEPEAEVVSIPITSDDD